MRAVLRSTSVRVVWNDWVRQVGRTVPRRVGYAVLTAIVAYFVLNAGVGAPVRLAVVLALTLAAGALVVSLVMAVAKLERERDQARRDYEIARQRIGAHIAIYAWVNNCEVMLRDPQRHRAIIGDWILVELEHLEASVIGSIEGYPFYPAEFVDEVRATAAEPGLSIGRVEALLALLRRNLLSGKYVRG